MLVGIVGRIQTRSYENQQGQRVYVTEVVAENFQVLEKRDNTANQNSMTAPATLIMQIKWTSMKVICRFEEVLNEIFRFICWHRWLSSWDGICWP
ncbi:MAG: single-stranded DNA-binding protein [Streptococcus parasanguinis]